MSIEPNRPIGQDEPHTRDPYERRISGRWIVVALIISGIVLFGISWALTKILPGFSPFVSNPG